MTAPIVRFAPSPTGLLHVGNARTALYNALYAQREGGSFILRYDDTDLARSTPAFADAIAEDLHWLGIPPDHIERQSDRTARYDAAVPGLEQFLLVQGRRKFVRPLLTALAEDRSWGRPIAVRVYAKARPLYHPVTSGSVDQLVGRP